MKKRSWLIPGAIFCLTPGLSQAEPFPAPKSLNSAAESVIVRITEGSKAWQQANEAVWPRLLEMLKQDNRRKLVVACMFDPSGSSSVELASCDQLRQEVKNWLVQLGVASHRIIQRTSPVGLMANEAAQAATAQARNLVEIRLAP